MQSLLSIAHALLLCATIIMGYDRGYCPMSLPQNVSGLCSKHRQLGLSRQMNTYQLNPPKKSMPYARLNVSIAHYRDFLKDKPFLADHAVLSAYIGKGVRKATAMYKKITRNRPDSMAYREYIEMYAFYTSFPERALGHKMRLPSKYELFQMDTTKYLSDQLFADQRLAGMNPMTLQRVTLSDKVGLNWKTLKATLNPVFDVKKAIGNTLGRHVGCEKSLETVIQDGLLFVLRYPLCDDMVYMKDIVDKDPRRTLWPFYSPIALFALVSSGNGSEAKLMPVAIQMDYKPESKVYTPKDGGKWTLAKLNVQVTDIGYVQVVEHLGKTHFIAEPICVSMERHLSHRHPLYAMLQFHCRGLLTTNTGAPLLMKHFHNLFAYGWKGAVRFLETASQQFTWDSVDLNLDIEKRGVESLPYYPYRDDGKKVLKAIREFVDDYVNLYYRSRNDVFMDKELQAFAKEISLEGNGKIDGFPSSVHTTRTLQSILTRFIWLVSCQHSAVSYPVVNYGAFVPNSPTKLYDDNRVPATGEYNILNLPGRGVAQKFNQLAAVAASMRFDKLFDYGDQLEDRAARHVVKRHYCKLSDELEPKLVEENEKRYKNGHLTYPYFMPRWLPNGIHG